MLKDKPIEKQRRVIILFGDLRHPVSDQLAKDIGPVDYILHLAAGSHVDRSIEHPMEFVLDNTVGTVNILEYARHYQPCLGKAHLPDKPSTYKFLDRKVCLLFNG